MIHTIELYGIKLTCEFSYYYSLGIPEIYPDREELTLEKIHTDGDIMDILDSHSRTVTIYADIKEKLLIYAREGNKN